jgi:hypothetical protein
MNSVFLDTGYLIALISNKDNLHRNAVTASTKFHGPFITTELVLVELANSLCLPSQRPIAVKIIEKIQADPLTTIEPLSADGFVKALQFYKKRADKEWGMIDCFSFITMETLGIKTALTFDQHFKQAGYKTPLL